MEEIKRAHTLISGEGIMTTAEKPVIHLPPGANGTQSSRFARPVTQEEAEMFVKLYYTDGLTVKQISEATGRGTYTISKVLNGKHPHFQFVQD